MTDQQAALEILRLVPAPPHLGPREQLVLTLQPLAPGVWAFQYRKGETK